MLTLMALPTSVAATMVRTKACRAAWRGAEAAQTAPQPAKRSTFLTASMTSLPRKVRSKAPDSRAVNPSRVRSKTGGGRVARRRTAR